MSINSMRLKNALTQKEVAAHLGVTQGAISQWESGKSVPRASSLIRLAKYFGCTIEDLLSNSKK